MPILRNPFRKAPGEHINDENVRSGFNTGFTGGINQKKSEQDGTSGKPMGINLSDAEQPTEYQLSEINDSGVYLPPPPEEKKGFWSTRSNSSARSSTHRNALNENEPFNISRESFDSYRRSFDISARSPVTESSPSYRPRQSLDVRHMRYPSTQSFSSFSSMRSQSLSQHPSQRSVQTLSSVYTAEPTSPVIHPSSDQVNVEPVTFAPLEPPMKQTRIFPSERPPTIPEPEADRFDDVALSDAKPKRHGLFSRFGVGSSTSDNNENNSKTNGNAGHGFFGRKRGTSGQGAELGAMNIRRPASRGALAGGGTSNGVQAQAQAPTQSKPQASPATTLQAAPVQPQPLHRPQTPSSQQNTHTPQMPQRPQTPQSQQRPQTPQSQQRPQTPQPLTTQQPQTQTYMEPQPQPQQQPQPEAHQEIQHANVQIGPQAAIPAQVAEANPELTEVVPTKVE